MCLFCKIAKGEIPADKVFEDSDIVAFYDINPQAPEHILIIPKKHISSVSEMKAEDIELIGKLVYRAKVIAEEKNFKDGAYRIVFNNGELAGQTVFHIHLHLLGGRAMMWPPG